MIKKRLAVFMIAVFIMSLPAIVNAQFGDEVKLVAPDGVAGDFFGYSVSVDGDTVIVGARGGDDTIEPGSAYVFVRDPATGIWSQQQKLTASDGRKWDYFGQSVSISGDTAMVGAAESNMTGAVYVFVRNPTTGNWTERQKLLASDSYFGDNFGGSVAISGDTAIIGADGDDYTGGLADYGAVYVFVRNPTTGNWTERQKLLASDNSYIWGSKFGGSVAIDGDMLIAGAMYNNDNGDYSGAAYVFMRNSSTGDWTEQQELLASDGARDDHFGESVSISGDTAMVGATGNNGINGTFSGSVYVYVRDPDTGDWTEQQKLTASGSTLYLGVSVSISGDIAIAGAYGNFSNNDYSGSASIFVRDPDTGVWTEQQKLFASDAAAFDRFGYSVSISGDTVIAGSRQDDDNGADSGSAYVYTSSGATAPDITVTDSIGVNDDLQMPFGDVTVGTSSTVETASISNAGNADLNVSGIQLTGADALEYTLDLTGGTNPCGVTTPTITPSKNCTVTITFSPASTGIKTANLEITSDDSDEGTVNVVLSGTGIAATAPEIDVTDTLAPDSDLVMPFGNITEGVSSTAETATISNVGTADLNVSNIRLTGADAGEYTLDLTGGATPCGVTTLTIAPGENCTVTVTFSPASTGLKTANLEITSDDPDEGAVNVALSGTGLPAVTNNPPDQPQLVFPANGQEVMGRMVTFKWKPVTDPDGDPVTYDLYYCEDSDPFNNCTFVEAASLEEKTDKPLYAGFWGYGGGLILFGIVFAAGFRDRKRIGLLTVMVIFAGALLVSCGSHSRHSNYKTYTVRGLNSGAVYYWGVAAKDDQGAETKSDVWRFTTR